MILLFDVGNTNIVLGMLENDEVKELARMSTDSKKTEDEYFALIDSILKFNLVDVSEIEDVVICSVVPTVTSALKRTSVKYFSKTPLIVGPGIKTGLNIKIDNPQTLGSDLVADSVAALKYYSKPSIVVDMGTATTLTVIDKDGTYQGGMILPGVNLSLEALSRGTAKLPKISFEEVKSVIGKDTVSCMQSGILFGTAAQIDGLVKMIEAELGNKCTVIMTGGISKVISKYMQVDHVIDELLIFKGLKEIYKKNKA